MSLPEIIPTHFEHPDSIRAADTDTTKPYILFEPRVSDGSRELTARECLEQMKKYAVAIDSVPPYTIQLGGSEVYTSIGEFLDTDGKDYLAEINDVSSTPPALVGILKNVAEIAEKSGFDRDKALIGAAFLNPAKATNVNAYLHSDGLSGRVMAWTANVKEVRFVYPLGPGTVIYPELPIDKHKSDVIEISMVNRVSTIRPENIDPIKAINAARHTKITEQEAFEGSMQQILPGIVLGFDPTRTFWHQAPDELRPVLVIDVFQREDAY